MSRSGYSDDGDYQHMELWRANVDRTIKGKVGQAFLKELIEALDAMPEKRLIQDSLKTGAEVCALGAVGLKRGLPMENLDPENPSQVGKAFGISSMLAQEVVYMNDDWGGPDQTPESRWLKMRDWAQSELKVDV